MLSSESTQQQLQKEGRQTCVTCTEENIWYPSFCNWCWVEEEKKAWCLRLLLKEYFLFDTLLFAAFSLPSYEHMHNEWKEALGNTSWDFAGYLNNFKIVLIYFFIQIWEPTFM